MTARANVDGKDLVYVGWVEKDNRPTREELIKEDMKEELYD